MWQPSMRCVVKDTGHVHISERVVLLQHGPYCGCSFGANSTTYGGSGRYSWGAAVKHGGVAIADMGASWTGHGEDGV